MNYAKLQRLCVSARLSAHFPHRILFLGGSEKPTEPFVRKKIINKAIKICRACDNLKGSKLQLGQTQDSSTSLSVLEIPLYNDLHLPLGIGTVKQQISYCLSPCNNTANPTCNPLAREITNPYLSNSLIPNFQFTCQGVCLALPRGCQGVWMWIIVHINEHNRLIFNFQLSSFNFQFTFLPRGK